MNNSWLILAMAILFEVCGTTSMKLSQQFSRIIPSIMIFFFYGLSFTSLTFALKSIDLGVAYAVWSGLGTMLITLVGIFYFNEPAGISKFIFLFMIIAGVSGLHLTGGSH